MSAKNPFVDGITNLAIPDSPDGVFLVNHSLKNGVLLADGSEIGGDIRMNNFRSKGVKFEGIYVKKDIYANAIMVKEYFIIAQSKLEGGLYIENAKIGEADLDLILEGPLDLNNSEFHNILKLSNVKTKRGIHLNNTVTNYIELSNIETPVLELKNCRILGCQSSDFNEDNIQVGSFILDNRTKIPACFLSYINNNYT